ncbi:membrane protein [Nitratireductor aestuarii]|uniref:Membrane protein n=1 Tax=Nitratireductor aestuarii TaxID=1735103 RepID=A0A916RNU4_9HYPH|nr:NfeD family protein [Nitratireductor aestuarii]GGA64219.1 membrane protein [Nitratireductor aestuarii]
MIISTLSDLGAWNWMLLGAILLALEIIIPGVFLLWIGIAALITGALSLQLWSMEIWSWQVQVIVFLVLSLVSVVVGKRWSDRAAAQSTDEPLLNMRAAQLIGRTAVLDHPIQEGRGRIRLDDTVWRVSGPDLPAGSRVKVVSVHGTELHVEAV